MYTEMLIASEIKYMVSKVEQWILSVLCMFESSNE